MSGLRSAAVCSFTESLAIARIVQPIRRAVAWLWHALDATRRALLNLLFLLLLLALAWLLLRGSGASPLQEKTALVLNLRGPIVEQASGSLRDRAVGSARGKARDQTRLRDVLAALETAATDSAIARVVLVLDDFGGAGPATLREVAAAITRFRAGGKQVVAWGSGYDQRGYYLAAHAGEIWLHPMGQVQIEGYGGRRSYYKDAFDRLGVQVQVLRAGQYKNAGEQYVASEPSPQTLEADTLLYGALWSLYTGGVEAARKLPAGSVMGYIDALPERVAAAGGDLAQTALAARFVDALKTRDQMRALLVERGAKDGETFRQIDLASYVARIRPRSGSDALAVVVAEGRIVDGIAGSGTVGGESTSALIRRAREDASVKALLLRVDSPGGSVFGSELVRRELELVRQAGKPVVVSMGDLAASGGYWISTAADEVIADAATVTGSIGVVAMLPNAAAALDRLGVNSAGVTTAWPLGAYDPRRGLDPRYAQVLQASIDHVYADFTAKVAAARKTTPQAIDAVGQGRVWTGAQALQRGLVDSVGGYGDAIAAAARRGKLQDGYRILYVEQQPGRREQLLAWFTGAVGIDAIAWPSLPSLPWPDDLVWLADLAQRPPAAMAHCWCAAP